MTNHPNRTAKFANPEITHVTVARTASNVVEYTLDGAHTFHANRTATFYGPHTGRSNSRQMMGPANTLWRERDDDLLRAFRAAYPEARIDLK